MHKGMKWLTGQHYQGRGRKEKLTKAQQVQLVKLSSMGGRPRKMDKSALMMAMNALTDTNSNATNVGKEAWNYNNNALSLR